MGSIKGLDVLSLKISEISGNRITTISRKHFEILGVRPKSRLDQGIAISHFRSVIDWERLSMLCGLRKLPIDAVQHGSLELKPALQKRK